MNDPLWSAARGWKSWASLAAAAMQRGEGRPAAILLAGSVAAGVVVGLLVASPGVPTTFQYQVGEFAAAAVRAPYDLSVPDEEGTRRMREEAAVYTPPVASFDPEPTTQLPARVSAVFEKARDAVAAADATRALPAADAARLTAAARRRAERARALDADRAVESAAQQMLAEVELTLGVALTPPERTMLAAGRFDRRFEDGLTALLREAYARPIAKDPRPLVEAAERSRPKDGTPRLVLRGTPPVPDRVLQDAAVLDDPAGATRRIRARAPYLLPASDAVERDLIVGLAERLIRPDTAYDEAATAARRAAAAAAVLPVSLTFKRNQLIVGEGQEITRERRLVLESLSRQARPGAYLARAAGTALVVSALLAAVLWFPLRFGLPRVPLRDGLFMLTGLVATATAFWIWLAVADAVSARLTGISRLAMILLFPATAVPMLAGLVLPRRYVAGLVAVSATVLGLLTELGAVYAGQALLVGLVGARMVSACARRSCVIRAGGGAGLAAAVGGLGVASLAGPGNGVAPALFPAAAAFAGAAVGAFVALALSGPAEWVFGYATRLRLVELLSYDHPLMRRLMDRAPGSFQHSVSVALLARAAAEAIGADALLVRVGALYHDVGKLEHPELFTENQRGVNPHDAMTPHASARAIVQHVDAGVRLLNQYGVGERVADFVREHQGTDLVTYFERKARAQGGEVDLADFRYPGPRPRSRETAVLMMADRVEATARSLDAPDREGFRAVVDRTLDGLLSSGQLDEAPLTLRDLSALRSSFVSALVDLHHKRVAYPRAGGDEGPSDRAARPSVGFV